MAKTKNRGRSAAKSKGSVVIKVVAVLLVLVAIAYVITSLVLGGQWNPLKWGKKDDVVEQNETGIIAVTSDGKKLIAENSYAMPRAMTFVNKSTAYSSAKEFNVTATLSNQYINGLFDWQVDFVNPASAWATGKSAEYYVQAVPTADGSATATVKYLEAFNEQIKVTATLRGTDKSDSCSVDCLKNVEMYSAWSDVVDFDDNIEGGCELSCTTGTVFADFRVRRAVFEMDVNFAEAVQSYLKFNIEIHGFGFESILGERYLAVDEQSNNRLQLSFFDVYLLSYEDFIENFEAYDEEHKEAIYYAWYHAANDVGFGNFEFDIEAYVNGVATGIFTNLDVATEVSGELYGKDIQPSVTLNTNVVF